MKWKLVYSQVPGCSYGNSPQYTQDCERCDMRLTAANAKMYIPIDSPEPIKSEIDKVEGLAGEQFMMTVTFDKPVKASDIKVMLGSQLDLVSVVAGAGDEGEVVKVTTKAKDGAVPGTYSIITTHNNINRIMDVIINPTPEAPEAEVELKTIKLKKNTLEVGETTEVTLGFEEKPAVEK